MPLGLRHRLLPMAYKKQKLVKAQYPKQQQRRGSFGPPSEIRGSIIEVGFQKDQY